MKEYPEFAPDSDNDDKEGTIDPCDESFYLSGCSSLSPYSEKDEIEESVSPPSSDRYIEFTIHEVLMLEEIKEQLSMHACASSISV